MTPNRAVFGAVFSACFLLFNTQALLADDNPGVEAAQRGNQFTSQYGAIKSDLKNILDDAKKLGENIKTVKDPQKSLSELQNFGPLCLMRSMRSRITEPSRNSPNPIYLIFRVNCRGRKASGPI